MKNYNEYNEKEKREIVNRGGDRKKELEKAILIWLDGLNLSEKAQELIETSDTNSILETFYTCETVADVESVALEYFDCE